MVPSSSPPPSFLTDPATTLVAPEFRHPAAWSTPVDLATGPLAGFGGTAPSFGVPETPPGGPDNDGSLMAAQAEFGMVALAGTEVAVPEFGAPAGGGSNPLAPLTVRFLDAKTGNVLATHPLPDAQQYYGMEPVTIGGKTDVEVRYAPTATTAPNGPFTSVVLDPTGAQVWTGAGQRIAGQPVQPGSTGLVGDKGTGLVHDGGYLERIDDADATDRTLKNATISVLDLTGRTLLTVPRNIVRSPADPIKSIQNNLQLSAGYAVSTTVDIPPTPSGGFPPNASNTLMPVRFTVYDLAHNAKKVANITEPAVPLSAGPVYGWGVVMATCGSKLLLEWPTVSLRTSSTGTTVNLAVLDTATGQATSPAITIPTSSQGTLESTLRAITDPACSAVLVNGTVGVTHQVQLAVDWAHGQPLWKQIGTYPPTTPGPLTIFQPLTVHGGVAYGLRTVGTETHAAAIGLSDGKVRESGFALSPVTFTAEGAPLFLQIDPDAPPPLYHLVTTTPPGATSGHTVIATTRPPSTPTPTATQASPAPSGGYAMTVWVGST
jgi:hypothetical protein